MKEKKKKNKILIIFIVILILLVLGLGGYIVYDKVLKEEPKEVEVKEEVKEPVKEEELDFYDPEELVKNNYIVKIETTETDYIKISNNKVLVKTVYDEDFKEVKGTKEVPKYVSFIPLCSDCQGLAYIVLTEEGNVYYAEDDFEIEGVSEFKKVNTEEIINIYNTQYYQQNKFYGETSNDVLLTVSNETMNTNNTFEKEFPYVDFVYRPNTGLSIAMKLDKDGKVFNHRDVELKFNSISVNAKEVVAKRFDDGVKFYIVSNDNNIYVYAPEIDDANLSLYNEEQIIDSYELVVKTSEEKTFDLKIKYVDGLAETISEVYATSTMYKRANN